MNDLILAAWFDESLIEAAGAGPPPTFISAWALSANDILGAGLMKKNVAGQKVGVEMVSATDGSAFTSAVTVYVTGDAGTQAVGSVGAGACTHEGNGFHTYAPAQAETNYDHIAFTFIGTGAVPATIQVFPTFPQTGDNFTRIGAPIGASISADIVAVQADTDNIQTRIPAALTANGNMKSSMVEILTTALTETAGLLAGGFKKFFNIASPVSTMDVLARVTLTDTLTTYTGNTLQTGDSYARLGAPAAASVSADILVLDNLVDDLESRLGTPSNLGGGATVAANLSDIEAQTDDIGAAGVGLTGIPWNASWDAEVQSEVNDALVAYPVPSAATVAGAVWNEDATGHQTQGSFGQAIGDPVADADTIWGLANTNLNATVSSRASQTSLDTVDDFLDTEVAAIKAKTDQLVFTTANRVDSQVFGVQASAIDAGAIATDAIGAAEFAQAAADKVWASAARTLTSLGAALVQEIWDRATSALTTVGSIGKLLVDNINATISSRASQTSVDDLPTNAELATALGTADDATLAAIDALPTALENADAIWDEALAGHLGAGSTGNALNGAGAAGDPWSTALPGAYGAGTAGKIIGDNINATVGSRSTQTSVDDLPTNAELTTALAAADDAVLAAIAALNNLSQAGVRTAVGLGAANLDTQLDALPTNAELATAIASADDPVLAVLATVQTLVDELHKIQGLSAGNPMTVTPTSRVAGAISLAITGDGITSSTVTR